MFFLFEIHFALNKYYLGVNEPFHYSLRKEKFKVIYKEVKSKEIIKLILCQN